MNEQEPRDLNVSHGHSHSSQPDSGLQYLKTSLIFRFIVVLVAMTAVATVVGVIALWPNNERSEEIQNKSSPNRVPDVKNQDESNYSDTETRCLVKP